MKAFPSEHPIPGYMDLKADGMNLRDYFAAKAMTIAAWKCQETSAAFCYQIADAMIKIREIKNDAI